MFFLVDIYKFFGLLQITQKKSKFADKCNTWKS